MSYPLPAELSASAERIVAALQLEAERYAVAAPKIALAGLQFTRITDPASQQAGYEGVWRNVRSDRCGTLTFNGDGSFYAEYDLFCPHPRDARWFVEMVTAWGNAETIRSEAKLIPAL
ncbi:MAG TPA: hypothetical protein VFF26_07575 [Gallionella sp.]|nr:hypothetical protein [Gallionella sp.]